MPQETFPYIFQVRDPLVCQSERQVSIQLNIKEGTHLKFQKNCQVPSQAPHQFICQIYSSRYPGLFPRDIPSIMPVITGFG